jgi:two-component system nitrogen regulation sensor histidine kinase NtrY
VIETIKKSFYKNGYLLIIAAWLYTISFIFSNYWFYTSSPERVQRKLEYFIAKSERKFENFAADTAVISSIFNNQYRPEAIVRDMRQDVALFVYTKNDVGNFLLDYWNNNKVLPGTKDLLRADGKHYVSYDNGKFEFVKKTILLKGRETLVAAVIPLHWDYFFKNKYLQSGYPTLGDIENRYMLVDTGAVRIKAKGERQEDRRRQSGHIVYFVKNTSSHLRFDLSKCFRPRHCKQERLGSRPCISYCVHPAFAVTQLQISVSF